MKATQLPSGSWRVRISIDGRRQSVTRPTKAEALADAAAILAGRSAVKHSPQNITVGEALQQYIDSRQDVLSPSTVLGYRNIANNRFTRLQARRVATMTQRQWQQAVNDEARICSAHTLKNAWLLIHGAVLQATGQDIHVTLPTVVPPDLDFLDREQMQKFCTAVRADRYEIPLLLALEGLRRSEVLALTWENIDLANDTIHVRGAVVQGDNGLAVKDTNKTAVSRRDIPFILPQLREALQNVPQEDRTGRVCPVYPTALSKHMKKLCERESLPNVGLHGLRRTFATVCHGIGVPEHYTMNWGGWSNIQTVHRIYVKLDANVGREYASRFKSAFDFGHENGHENSEAQQ